MKRLAWLIVILVLSLPFLTQCTQPVRGAFVSYDTPFDALARWVPAGATEATFVDFKPTGEMGRHWAHIRQHLEANPTGQQVLGGVSALYKVGEYDLSEFALGPAVNWYCQRETGNIFQVNDEVAVEEALREHFDGPTWEQTEYRGLTLHHGRTRTSRDWLAWTVRDGLLFLSSDYDGSAEDVLTQLQDIVGLPESESLAALPAWQTLRARMPETSMGLLFNNVAEQSRGYPPASDTTSASTALGQQIEAMSFAAVPEEQGMRVEIDSLAALQPDAPPEIRALFDLPAVDPAAWPHLPADTAIAFVTHDAPVVWPLLSEIFGLAKPVPQLRDAVGLDLEADLAGADGPLTGDFAVAITPPLPDQPIVQGLPAGQLLILTRDATEAQMAGVQAAMEARGATFGPGEAAGVALHVQAGTAPSGYAIAYGSDEDTLLFGSSPAIIGRGVAARREGRGLVTDHAFQATLATLPEDSSFVLYLNVRPWVNLLQANMTQEQYQNRPEYVGLETFEAIGLGLRFVPDRVDGCIYFFLPE